MHVKTVAILWHDPAGSGSDTPRGRRSSSSDHCRKVQL